MAILDLLHVKYSDNNFKDKFILIVMQFKLVYYYIYFDIVYSMILFMCASISTTRSLLPGGR